MFDELITILSALKASINSHRPILNANETCTRMALVDPLLRALDWDTTNPALVVPEYNVDGTRADYALMGSEGEIPVAVIEAKKLGMPLEGKETDQMITYATKAAIPIAGLTDGDRWQLYDVFERVPLPQKCILDTSVASTPEYKLALELLILWRPNLASSEPIKAPCPIIKPPSPCPGPEPPLPDPSRWCPICEFETASNERPKSIKFRDGKEYPIRYWLDILWRSAEWLWQEKLIDEDEVPYPSIAPNSNNANRKRGRRYILNHEPKHPSGADFRIPRKISRNGEKLYVECSYESKIIVDRAKRLLKHFGGEPQEVLLRLA